MGRFAPPPGYRIQDNKLGLTASLLAGRAAKCLLPPRPPLKGWAVKVLGCPQAAGQPTKNRDLKCITIIFTDKLVFTDMSIVQCQFYSIELWKSLGSFPPHLIEI